MNRLGAGVLLSSGYRNHSNRQNCIRAVVQVPADPTFPVEGTYEIVFAYGENTKWDSCAGHDGFLNSSGVPGPRITLDFLVAGSQWTRTWEIRKDDYTDPGVMAINITDTVTDIGEYIAEYIAAALAFESTATGAGLYTTISEGDMHIMAVTAEDVGQWNSKPAKDNDTLNLITIGVFTP